MRILWRAVSYLLPHKPRVFISCAAASHFYRVSLSGSSYMFPVCSAVLLLAGWLPFSPSSYFSFHFPSSLHSIPSSSLLHIYIYIYPAHIPRCAHRYQRFADNDLEITHLSEFFFGRGIVMFYVLVAWKYLCIYTVAYNFRPYMYVFLSLFLVLFSLT